MGEIVDATAAHRFTGVAPSVALHIPWDEVDDFTALVTDAVDQGARLCTVTAHTLQDDK